MDFFYCFFFPRRENIPEKLKKSKKIKKNQKNFFLGFFPWIFLAFCGFFAEKIFEKVVYNAFFAGIYN